MTRAAPAGKRPHDIDAMLARIREAVAPLPRPVLFELAEEGYRSPFEQLVACIVTVRTLEEVSGPAIRRLFARARTPAALARLDPAEIEALVRPATYSEPKARQIHAIAQRVVAEFGGALPCDYDLLTSFSGVGPKCAGLVLGIACGQPRIGVDVHVHRVTNRWGYVRTSAPEQTMLALERKLPKRYWLEINRLLVPFGKYVCTGRLPKCSTCPVFEFCQQVGVTSHR